MQQWDTVLWTDESTFQHFSGAKRAFMRRRFVERYNPQCIVPPPVKRGGGSLVVWGCMSGQGDGQLYRSEGTVRQDQYVSVLMNHMLPSGSSLYGECEAFVFQRDNAPCHKANKVTRFLERSHVEVLQCSAQSHT